jgi:hypothetical protein
MILLSVPTGAEAGKPCPCVSLTCKNQKAIESILKQLETHGAKDMVNPKELAPAILHMSQYYNVDYRVITKVLLLESRGRANAYNKRTRDYGLMQVNIRTAEYYNVSKKCLADWRCNLRIGVEILKKAKRACNYNVGNSKLTHARMKRCLIYERKLASINWGV